MSAISRPSGWLWVAQRTTDRRGCHPGNPRHARAFTLVEMLIAMALTLILVYAIAEFYVYVGDTVKDGRAMIEMNGQMRIAVARLKADLELLTVPVVPWADDGSAMGYFEIVEGPRSDIDANGNNLLDANEVNDFALANVTSLLGDTDDVIAFTIRSDGEPFTGRHYNAATGNYDPITSNLAEVIWFTGFTDRDADGRWDADEPRFLYRRVLLIRPDLGRNLTIPAGFPNDSIFHHNDVSAHFVFVPGGPSFWQANSLNELSRRENRFAHTSLASNFPNTLVLGPDLSAGVSAFMQFTLSGEFFGEDRILANVLAFDVRVFDPTAPILGDGELVDSNSDTSDDAVGTVQPGDPGWEAAAALNTGDRNRYPILGFGAYVDLYYGRYAPTIPLLPSGAASPRSAFYGVPAAKSQMGIGVYDTWATSYERDGVNQDGDTDPFSGQPLFDEGTDGLDNDGINGVDDPDERETSPPYPVPLRGIQVKIRLYEPGTRQVRQATVGWDFIFE